MSLKCNKNKHLWDLTERLMTLLNWFSSKRGMILNYTVVSTKPSSAAINILQNYEEFAIVIQGPILYPRFTSSTIDFYSSNFKQVKIYVSTWKSEKALSRIDSKCSWRLIQSVRPKNSGLANINLQATTTLAGLNQANHDGCKYVLKIRSDQGLFASNSLDQFLFALQHAPKSQHGRIATTDFNSFLFRPNSPSDQIQFATTENLVNFWSSYKMEEEQFGSFPEEILFLAYSHAFLGKFPKSLRDSLEIYRDYFVFLDSTDLGLVWRKGSWRHPDSRFDQLDRKSRLRFVSPDEWRRLNTDIESVLSEARKLGISDT